MTIATWIERVLARFGKARLIQDSEGPARPSQGSESKSAALDRPEPDPVESEALLKEAAETANLGIWIRDDVEDRCVYCSETLARMHGMTTDECLARYATMEGLLQIFHPEDRDRYKQVVTEAGEGGQAYDITLRELRPNGETVFLRERGHPVLDTAGKLIRTVGILQDITDHRRIEHELRQARDQLESRVAERTAALEEANQALRESEKRLTQAQDLAKIGHAIWDEIEGRMAYHSETLDLIWGTPREEIFANFGGFLDTVHPDDRERVDLVMEQANKDRTGFEIGYRIVHPDGEIRVIHEIAEPEFDKTGRLVRTVSTVQDITEQKRVEEELRESKERYRELFEESPVAIWEDDWSPVKQMLDDLARGGVKDWRGYFDSHRDQLRTAYDLAKIIEISRAAIDLYRAESKEELACMATSTVSIDEELDAFREIVLSFLAGRMTVDIEAKDMAGDGSEIIVRRRVVIPPKYRDDWSRVIFAIEDITERARVEEQLRQAQKMEAVGQLTGGIAHDFNNLLAVVMGNTELLQDRLGREDQPLIAILRAATRGAELTQRLLAFSRQQPLKPQAIDLGSLVSGMSDLMARTLGETIEIEAGAAAGLWRASADPGQMENAILNLAINARDAMPGGGKLTIECANVVLDEAYVAENPEAMAGEYVVLALSDEGSGMTAEVRAHAFEPFYTTKEVGHGSGLGLSMVYGFAKQSGGQVTIYSEEGKGTTVRLYLPREGTAWRTGEASSSEAVPRGRGETILVIEDDPDVRALAVKMLEALGYLVIRVPAAAEARKALAEGPPVDLVLSDVVLPGGISGPEFAEEVRTTYPGLEIVFMSGYPAEAAKRNGFLGSDKVLLSKPFQRHQLAKALRDALG